MLKFLIGFIVGWLTTELLRNWYENTTSASVANIVDKILYFPIQVLTYACYIILFPFIWAHQMFKNVIHPVTPEQWKRAKIKRYLGKHNFKVVFDWDARPIVNKIFFVRIANSDKLKPEYIVETNKPSSPEGEYRIGPEWDENSNRTEGHNGE